MFKSVIVRKMETKRKRYAHERYTAHFSVTSISCILPVYQWWICITLKFLVLHWRASGNACKQTVSSFGAPPALALFDRAFACEYTQQNNICSACVERAVHNKNKARARMWLTCIVRTVHKPGNQCNYHNTRNAVASPEYSSVMLIQ